MVNVKESKSLWIVCALYLLTKGLAALKALKSVKAVGVVLSPLLMAISSLAYGFYFGSFYFGIGLVMLILIHEAGHMWACRREGVPHSLPYFIPFLGAMIMTKIPKSAHSEAVIAFGGPLIGSIGAVACIGVAFMFPAGSNASIIFHLLGSTGLMLNLFNLIPIRPFDGGRILATLPSAVQYIGFCVVWALAYITQDAIFVFMLMLTLDEIPIRAVVRRSLLALMLAVFSIMLAMSGSILWQVCAVILGVLALLVCRYAFHARDIPLESSDFEHDQSSLRVKILWSCAYTSLSVTLFALIVWQMNHLPPEAKGFLDISSFI
jgi:Zn-dependent protease